MWENPKSIFDGDQEIARYCGAPHVEFPLLSSSNHVIVNFVSDEKYEGKQNKDKRQT